MHETTTSVQATGETGSEPPSSGGPVSVAWADPSGLLAPPGLAWLRQTSARALGELGVRGEVRVRVVDDAEMALAHERYAGVPGTTDVLTFDLGEGGGARGEPLDADLLVCADEARRRSVERGHPPERELLLYVVHGVLHCLGEDDHDEERAARMHAREDGVLSAIGVGPVYGVVPLAEARA